MYGWFYTKTEVTGTITYLNTGQSPSVVVVGADVLLFGRLKRGPIRSVIGRLLRSV